MKANGKLASVLAGSLMLAGSAQAAEQAEGAEASLTHGVGYDSLVVSALKEARDELKEYIGEDGALPSEVLGAAQQMNFYLAGLSEEIKAHLGAEGCRIFIDKSSKESKKASKPIYRACKKPMMGVDRAVSNARVGFKEGKKSELAQSVEKKGVIKVETQQRVEAKKEVLSEKTQGNEEKKVKSAENQKTIESQDAVIAILKDHVATL